MKLSYILPIAAVILLTAFSVSSYKSVRLFDGKTFTGWEGDTINTWRISNGMLIGGSTDKMQPHNEFISTVGTYSNYILRLKFKLTGTEGFINTGVQFHSKRISNPPYEMTGYQADLGDGFWGCLYDESRRDKILVGPDSNVIKKALRRNQWNDYEIYSNNGRIRIKLNGAQTIDYTEPDKTIPQQGHIALQLHGGGKTEVSYKDIVLQEIK